MAGEVVAPSIFGRLLDRFQGPGLHSVALIVHLMSVIFPHAAHLLLAPSDGSDYVFCFCMLAYAGVAFLVSWRDASHDTLHLALDHGDHSLHGII